MCACVAFAMHFPSALLAHQVYFYVEFPSLGWKVFHYWVGKFSITGLESFPSLARKVIHLVIKRSLEMCASMDFQRIFAMMYYICLCSCLSNFQNIFHPRIEKFLSLNFVTPTSFFVS